MLTSRFPGEVSGADLPTLTNPAGAGDIAAGKQAIRQDGGVVTGNVPTPNSVTLEDGTVEVGVSIGGGGVFLATGTMASDNLLRAGKTVQVSMAASAFGNAEAADVAAGKTFTSGAGIAIAGTLPEKTEGSAAVVLSTESAQLVAKTQISLANNFIKLSCPNRSGDMVLRSGAPVQILALPAAFGDATAADVAAGKTFTSSAGVKVTGTGTIAEIITRSAVVTITPDEVIVGEVDKVITYTCPDGYIPFSISTSNPNAIVKITSVELISPVQGRWKLTYNMTWAGDTMEEVASTISLIKV